MRSATTKQLSEEMLPEWRKQQAGRTVVFTNGCFDLLHAGHVHFLEQARSRGDLLIVGLNDDESIKMLKGEKRPINKFEDRAMVLGGLEAVDFVAPLTGLRATSLIFAVSPHVWVKGGDYTLQTLDATERRAAASCGAEIVLVPYLEGYSTSATVIKISS
jgi:D-glycero-beta-D-manno-heptose 1-phosphate adenylyltransferase